MSQPRMRPRFALQVNADIEDVMQALLSGCDQVGAPGAHLEGQFSSRHGIVGFPAAARHFWSPYLSLTVEATGDPAPSAAPTRIRCVFSPHPHIWQAFVFTYLTLFAAGFFAAMLGAAQAILGRTPWGLMITLGSLALGAFVYGATFIGQGLGANEMYVLRRYLDDSVEIAEEEHRKSNAEAGWP